MTTRIAFATATAAFLSFAALPAAAADIEVLVGNGTGYEASIQWLSAGGSEPKTAPAGTQRSMTIPFVDGTTYMMIIQLVGVPSGSGRPGWNSMCRPSFTAAGSYLVSVAQYSGEALSCQTSNR